LNNPRKLRGSGEWPMLFAFLPKLRGIDYYTRRTGAKTA
jgi:hypothetical protein